MADAPLTELERELLELCSMDAEGGETTTTLYVEMLQSPPDRATLEATLRGLVDRGLMTRWRGLYSGSQRDRRTGEVTSVEYEDDWWPVTDAGRAAIGLPPRAQTVEGGWTNPSSGYWRVAADRSLLRLAIEARQATHPRVVRTADGKRAFVAR
jgi:hypothetical protein